HGSLRRRSIPCSPHEGKLVCGGRVRVRVSGSHCAIFSLPRGEGAVRHVPCRSSPCMQNSNAYPGRQQGAVVTTPMVIYRARRSFAMIALALGTADVCRWQRGSNMRDATMIDLYSDTMTKPTPAMRQSMAAAEAGDEQKGEDPTVNRLQEMVAELLGKEAAVYLPSGTMCNEISFAVWARTGDEMILHRDSHPVHFEVGGPAFLARMMLYPLDGP